MESYNLIRNELCNHIEDGQTFSLSPAEDSARGDLSTNIAFIIAKEKNLSPKFCATELVTLLENKLESIVEKIEVAGPGFINFFLKAGFVRMENEKDKIDITTRFTGKNILVEHSSPNLFKPFSIGHLMNNIIGEFVTRAIKIGGADVTTISFPSDISLGIAKALFIINRDLKDNKIDIKFFDNNEEDKVINYLGESYIRGVKECEENEESLNYAKNILEKMYDVSTEKKSDPEFKSIIEKTKSINENYFKAFIKDVGSNIDNFIYESEAGERGKKIVEENTGDGKVFKKSEGAIVYVPDEERKDINTSVFINSQGFPTYEAKDIGLLDIKFSKYNPDNSFFITDMEQAPHFKVVLDAASKLGGDWKERVEKSKHIPHGRMLFKGEKMSSRLGGIPLALDVIKVVEEEVRERAGEKIEHLSSEEKKKLERDIALSALRVSVLRSKPGININFDPETSLSFEGDSGPYLMYTHARCASLLEKGNEKDLHPKFSDVTNIELEKELSFFEVMLTESIEALSPQKVVTYLFSIAQKFNNFYATTQIISEDKIKSEHNLAIVKRTKFILREGLNVLGINAPEKM